MFNILLKMIRYIKKSIFINKFKHCERSSRFGNIGCGEDCTILGMENMCIGHNTWIGPASEVYVYNSHLKRKLNAELIIGDNVRVTSRCRITCAGKIVIGNNVLIAPDVFITDHNHGMDPTVEAGYSSQPLIIKNVVIEEGVWLGQKVSVLPGVKIGKHSIIGANSVVTRDIPAYSIAVGIPAKVIKCWNKESKRWEKV